MKFIYTFLVFFYIIIPISAKIGVTRQSYYRSVFQGKNGETNIISRNKIMATTKISSCDGEENLKSDIGVLSYFIGGMSSFVGIFDLIVFSVTSNNNSIESTFLGLLLWVPSAVLTFFALSDPLSYLIGNLISVASLVVTLYGGIGVLLGTTDNLVSLVDEFLGTISLILSAVTTFPEMYEELKQLLRDNLGKELVDSWIQGYGCGGSSI